MSVEVNSVLACCFFFSPHLCTILSFTPYQRSSNAFAEFAAIEYYKYSVLEDDGHTSTSSSVVPWHVITMANTKDNKSILSASPSVAIAHT